MAPDGSDRRSRIAVGDIHVEIEFKAIRNLHLAVYPPDGRVRVAAPGHLDEDAVRLAVVKRLAWVRRQQRELRAAQRISEREMTTGESHYVWGRRLLLKLVESGRRTKVTVDGSRLVVTVPPGTRPAERAKVLARWERRQLRERIPALLAEWEPALGVGVGRLGHSAHEDQVGLLQPVDRPRLDQYRARQEEPTVPGVHRRPRTPPRP